MGIIEKINNIQKQFDENINSHVFLIETDDSNKATTDIKKIIEHALNADKTTKMQIEDESYIELAIIRPNGISIVKDDILKLQDQLKTKSVLSDKKFYIIVDADLLNDSAANKLLKTIEEPHDGIHGFLITKNISAILPTIKSRCQIEKLYYDDAVKIKEYSPEEQTLAEKIIKIIEQGSFKDIIIYKLSNPKAKDFIKTNGKSVANIIKDYYNISCGIEKGNLSDKIVEVITENNTIQELVDKAMYINKLLNKITINMNTELLIDKIILELKEVKCDESSRNQV